MKYLITGASGFVGKPLTKALVSDGHDVLAFAGTNTYPEHEKSLLKIHITPATNWTSYLQDIDVVFHLAARVHVMKDLSNDPLVEFVNQNLHITSNLAQQAAEVGVKRFVYVSSIKVNGEFINSEPFKENDDPSPQDPYAISKYQAEQVLHEIASKTTMEVVILRPPLVYGPGVKANFLSLLTNISKGRVLPLAAINNKRSLIYLGNLVDALIQCAVHPAAAGNTYLVSDGQDVSTPELIRRIADSLQTPAMLLSVPLPLMGFIAKLLGKSSSVERLTQSLVIDSSKIRNELDWSPPYTLEQGLAATAAWFKENH